MSTKFKTSLVNLQKDIKNNVNATETLKRIVMFR